MYNQQSFSSYRGSASPMATSFGGSSMSSSQYRGMQSSFQPTGYVQSFYGQGGQSGMMQSASAFHGANYRGDQTGHDQYLRGDSPNPSNMGGFSQTSSSFSPLTSQFSGAQSYSPVSSGYGQSMNAGSFHTANYRGNQPGHDQYLRGDSGQPANMGSFGSSSYGMGTTGSYGASTGSSFGTSSFGYQNQGGQMSSNAFHSANYRGNQQGHDQYLRGDSGQPANMGGYGMSSTGRF